VQNDTILLRYFRYWRWRAGINGAMSLNPGVRW